MGPDKNAAYPIEGNDVLHYVKNTVKASNIIVGDYTYYSAQSPDETFEDRVLFNFELLGEKLILGKFTCMGPGTCFVMGGANHRMDGSTYPFNIFGHGWERHTPSLEELPLKGDTVVGNDVWIGMEAMIMPGVTIGDGAIVSARALVTSDVPPYTIVGGNPAKKIKQRFDDETVKRWQALEWWNLPEEVILKNIDLITAGKLEALEALKASL